METKRTVEQLRRAADQAAEVFRIRAQVRDLDKQARILEDKADVLSNELLDNGFRVDVILGNVAVSVILGHEDRPVVPEQRMVHSPPNTPDVDLKRVPSNFPIGDALKMVCKVCLGTEGVAMVTVPGDAHLTEEQPRCIHHQPAKKK